MMHSHYGSNKSERRFSASIGAMLAAVLACACAIARAESGEASQLIARAEAGEASPAAAPDPSKLVWAARICYLEASFRESDCIALLWVAKKRASRVDRPWLDVLRDYSAINASNERARRVRAFPWGDIDGRSDVFNRSWERLRELVTEFAEGKHKDPCPRAEHWGGTMDHPHGRMVKARCAAATVNTFYAVKKAPARN